MRAQALCGLLAFCLTTPGCKSDEAADSSTLSLQNRVATLEEQSIIQGQRINALTVQVNDLKGYYAVDSEDTLDSIAQKFGLTVTQLIALNPQLTDPQQLKIGVLLRIKPLNP